jgi:class 3 adenylate cyclase
VAEARTAGDVELRAATLRQALSLWRGPALADLAYEGFAGVEAARLEELRAAVEEDSFDAELELGHHAELVSPLEALVERRPYDERARAQLMLALYRSGRQADALDAFKDARATLAEELGLEPSPALRELERAILLQEPSLVAEADALAEERRQSVTVLSVELTPPSEADPERLRASLVDCIAIARAAVTRHEGWVTTRAGDELLGIFGVPVAHEDDARRAARAALELRDAIGATGVRIGIETGPALTGHGFVTET